MRVKVTVKGLEFRVKDTIKDRVFSARVRDTDTVEGLGLALG